MNIVKNILNSKFNNLKPVYLLYGDESYLLEDFLQKFIQKFVQPDIKDFMLSIIKEEETEDFAMKLFEICNTVSMISPHRVILAYCTDGLAKEKEERSYLKKLLTNFPQGTVLILVAKKKPDEKSELVKLILKIGEKIEFSTLHGQDLTRWIEHQFSLANKKVVTNGVLFLEENFLNNLRVLKSEIEKIITYVGEKDIVSLEDIKSVVSKDIILKDTIIFDLVDAVGNRQIKKALMILDNMEREGESMFLILKMFIRQLRLIMFSKEMSEKGFPPEDTAKRLKQHPYPIKKCYGQARNFTLDQLERALERMLQANYDIVCGKYSDKLALQLALIDLKETLG